MHARRVQAARHVAKLHSISESKVSFIEGDALAADLSGVDWIYLTDLAWERKLQSSVAEHIKRTAREDAVIVTNARDYMWQPLGFRKLGSVEVAVSWTSVMRFSAWQPPLRIN